jgi:hypothetical protein
VFVNLLCVLTICGPFPTYSKGEVMGMVIFKTCINCISTFTSMKNTLIASVISVLYSYWLYHHN